MKIPATIGVLTYNSAEHLARALRSVSDFAEIIIADGGSTDSTLEIAEEFGARIIPQSNPGHPIRDFALERNRLLSAATQPWFFYLDSDEIASPELVSFIREVSSAAENPFSAYRVRYLKTNTDASKIYRTYKEYYQLRLTRTDVGARFERPVHERIIVPADVVVGQVEASWYVPLDSEDLSFRVFTKKAWKRTAVTANMWNPNGLFNVIDAIFIGPLILISKSFVKMIVVKIRFRGAAIPARYELLRIVYASFLSMQCIRRLIRGRA